MQPCPVVEGRHRHESNRRRHRVSQVDVEGRSEHAAWIVTAAQSLQPLIETVHHQGDDRLLEGRVCDLQSLAHGAAQPFVVRRPARMARIAGEAAGDRMVVAVAKHRQLRKLRRDSRNDLTITVLDEVQPVGEGLTVDVPFDGTPRFEWLDDLLDG